MTSLLKPIIATNMDKGLCREWNEDSVSAFVSPLGDRALLMVADGMGGVSEDGTVLGKLASQLVIDTLHCELCDLLDEADSGIDQGFSEEFLCTRFYLASQKANAVLNAHRKCNKELFTSTVTWAFVHNDQALVANTGDCRTYLFRDNELRLITNNWPLGAGDPPPRSVTFHYGVPLGAGGGVRVRQCDPSCRVLPELDASSVNLYIWKQQTLQAGDLLLLCTDGLWSWIDTAEIERQLSWITSPGEAAQRLVEASNLSGGHDNIGVLVCEMVANSQLAGNNADASCSKDFPTRDCG